MELRGNSPRRRGFLHLVTPDDAEPAGGLDVIAAFSDGAPSPWARPAEDDCGWQLSRLGFARHWARLMSVFAVPDSSEAQQLLRMHEYRETLRDLTDDVWSDVVDLAKRKWTSRHVPPPARLLKYAEAVLKERRGDQARQALLPLLWPMSAG